MYEEESQRLAYWWYSQHPQFPAPCSSDSVVQPKLQAWIFFHDPAVSKLRLAMLFVAGLFYMTPQNDFNHCLEKILNPFR